MADYEGLRKSVTIICPEHGKFEQLASVHLHNKSGCPKCSAHRRGRAKANKAALNFAKRASKVHAGRYSYERVNYKTSQDNVEILCPEHGSFLQKPNNHLFGNGCLLHVVLVVEQCQRFLVGEHAAKAARWNPKNPSIKEANRLICKP